MQIIGVEASQKYHIPVYNVGDIGPGGGIVYYKASTPQSWGQFMEVIPDRTGEINSVWANAGFLTTDPAGAGYLQDGKIGTSVKGTKAMLAQDPTNPIASAVRSLTFGGLNDWYLPSYEDFVEIPFSSMSSAIKASLGFRSGNYWTCSSGVTMGTSGSSAGFGNVTSAGTWNFGGSTSKTTVDYVRAIRYFFAENPTYQMHYEVGDIGPSGGYVIYKAATPQSWGQYIEAAPYNWAGGGNDPYRRTAQYPNDTIGVGTVNTIGGSITNRALYLAQQENWTIDIGFETWAQKCRDYTGGGFTNWTIPTIAEWNASLMSSSEATSLLQMSSPDGYAMSNELTASTYPMELEGIDYRAGNTRTKSNASRIRPIRHF